MKAHGFTVCVASSPEVELEQFGAREEVPFHAIKMSRRITPLRDLVALAKLFRLLRRIRPAIVHAHTPKAGLLGMLGATLARVPVRIYHLHGLPHVTARGYKQRLLRWSERTACKLAHQVFCVSRSLMKVAISERVCPPESIKTLLRGSISGIDAARTFNPDSDLEIRGRTRTAYNIPCDSLVLGFVGRIGCDKGIEELWEAWRCLRSEFPSLHLLVVGPFDERDPIRPELMNSFRDDPKVHLTGQVEETSPFYSAMDVFALPSHREGFGLAAIEASAMKLPVVASRIAGCVDATLDGVTGTLVQPRDASALSDAIRRYLLDSELRLQHGRAGRHRVLRDFRQDEIWQTLESEYRRLLRASRLEQPTTLETRAQAFSRRRAHQIALKRALDVAGATVGLVLVQNDGGLVRSTGRACGR
jgi:glycosyltransferase involved in cell wall biosynthesis